MTDPFDMKDPEKPVTRHECAMNRRVYENTVYVRLDTVLKEQERLSVAVEKQGDTLGKVMNRITDMAEDVSELKATERERRDHKRFSTRNRKGDGIEAAVGGLMLRFGLPALKALGIGGGTLALWELFVKALLQSIGN